MSLQVEKLEKTWQTYIEVSAEEFEKAMKAAYNHNKGRFNIPGFQTRQGSAGHDREKCTAQASSTRMLQTQ